MNNFKRTMRDLKSDRERDGSPNFPFKNASAVAQNAFYTVDFEGDSAYKKYLPFDNIQIINQSPNVIEYFINDESYGYSPAYGIENISDIGIFRFKIMNVDSADIAANKLLVKVWKAPKSIRAVR